MDEKKDLHEVYMWLREDAIDVWAMAVRSVLPYYFVGLDTSDILAATNYDTYHNVCRSHSSLIRKIGGDAIGLLKNITLMAVVFHSTSLTRFPYPFVSNY
jgi:hypothetical protein